ncbi:hypothetical protein [Streptomyces sp. N35]|uniref:hypothetical protein n=1 Tax=Streptomyces sp. N35 TaxID=2795730 RepID=UPI0018F68498|nr:hypothetical protein [Streptomyces sp. N35]
MSNARIVGVTVDLDEGPVLTRHGRTDYDGRPFAHILIGADLALTLTHASRQAIVDLIAAGEELLAWHDQQAAKQVAA